MKSLVQVLTVAAIVFLFALPAMSSGSVAAGTSVDSELLTRLAEFEDFARSKVRQLNQNHKNSQSQMKITQKKDGTYRARYHKIDDSTMQVKVRRSQSDSAPYVGIIIYREQIFESSAGAPEEFENDMFAVVEVIPNRHIFSFRKGVWN
jgi:Tfp pilus assembly protein FimT